MCVEWAGGEGIGEFGKEGLSGEGLEARKGCVMYFLWDMFSLWPCLNTGPVMSGMVVFRAMFPANALKKDCIQPTATSTYEIWSPVFTELTVRNTFPISPK